MTHLIDTEPTPAAPINHPIYGGVMEAIFSKSLKAGDRTYFIDVKEAKNRAKYLSIAESRPSKEGDKKFTRTSVMIFDNLLEEFRGAIEEAFKQMQK